MASETSQDADSKSEGSITKLEPVSSRLNEPEEQIEASSSRPKKPEAVKATVSESAPAPSVKSTPMKAPMKETPKLHNGQTSEGRDIHTDKGKVNSKEIIPEIPRHAPTMPVTGSSKSQTPEVKSLASALSQFMETQNALAQATGGSAMPTGNPADAVSSIKLQYKQMLMVDGE